MIDDRPSVLGCIM